MSERRRILRVIAGLSVVGTCLVVAAVGGLAVVAEFVDNWTWFFRMERAASMAVPLVLVLLSVAVTSTLGLVFTAE